MVSTTTASKIVQTMNKTDKMVTIAIIGAIKESNKISLQLIKEKCGPLALKLDEIEPNNLVQYTRSANERFVKEKLLSFDKDGIINKNVLLQIQDKHNYEDINASLNFFTAPAYDLEKVLNNEETFSKLIEVMNENTAEKSSEKIGQNSDLAVEIKKLRKDLKKTYNRFDKKLEELELKIQSNADDLDNN